MSQYIPLITPELIAEFGISLDGQDAESFIKHLNDTLDERVGAEVIESLDDEQLAVLANLQENATDEEVEKWMLENVPDIEQIAQNEIDILLGEVAEQSDAVNDITSEEE
jgi:hypothetical protein